MTYKDAPPPPARKGSHVSPTNNPTLNQCSGLLVEHNYEYNIANGYGVRR